MPDSLDRGVPPVYVGPKPSRPELIIDQHGVYLCDADGNFVGFDDNWGRGGPLARVVYAGRAQSRDL
jgi:hypothetical protein